MHNNKKKNTETKRDSEDRNMALILSYEGTNYQGFQSQPTALTIQNKLEEALLKLTKEKITLYASGRTDAGVHARCQVVSFKTRSCIPVSKWPIALNTQLPEDIVVQRACHVPKEFHANYDTLSKTYRYTINCQRTPDLFQRRYQFYHPAPLNVEHMRQGLAYLVGEHDFSSFTSRRSTKKSHIRTILQAWVETENLSAGVDSQKQRGVIHLYIQGNGFLYNMVRIIAGTLIQVGRGKRPPQEVAAILAAKSRLAAGPTAVSCGLCLWDIAYENIQNPLV